MQYLGLWDKLYILGESILTVKATVGIWAGFRDFTTESRSMAWIQTDEFPIITLEQRRRNRQRKMVTRTWVLIGGCLLFMLLPLAFAYFSQDWSLMWKVLYFLLTFLVPFLCPALTAGMIAGERETGALDMLLLTPLSAARIIGEKYTTALQSLLPFTIFLTLVYVIALCISSLEQIPTMVLNALLLIVLTAFYVAVGLTASCIAHTTRTALMIAYGFVFVWVIVIPSITTMVMLLLSRHLQLGFSGRWSFLQPLLNPTVLDVAKLLLHAVLLVLLLLFANKRLDLLRRTA